VLRGRRTHQLRARPKRILWNCFENVDINVLGFVIVAMFVATSVIALSIWRLGRIEERWSAHPEDSAAVD
jgi:hypothetical protein